MKRNSCRVWLAGTVVVVMALMFRPGSGLAEKGDIYFAQGTHFLKTAKLGEAIGAFTEAIRLAPDRVEAYINRGLAYLEQKRYREAKRDFQKALAIAPNDPKANNNMGVFFCGREDYDRALHYIRRAAGARGLSASYGAVVYRNLGFVYTKKGMSEEAKTAYGKARRMMLSKSFSHLDRRGYSGGSQNYALTLEFQSDSRKKE